MAAALIVFRDSAVANIRLEEQARKQREQADEQRQQTEKQRLQNVEAQARAAAEQTKAVNALVDGLSKLSDGALTFRLSEDIPEAYSQIKDNFNASISRLQETLVAIAMAAKEVTSASGDISSSAADLSARTEQQSKSLQQTSSALEEISATVKKTAENAQQVSLSATQARDLANRGGEVAAAAVETMARVESASHKVSNFIGVIDEIARQSNLLALNAAVEAARVGDVGRGFAVVASEVRVLAQRSSAAATDIKNLIADSDSQVKEGAALVNRAGMTLTEIVQSINGVADIVVDIATASGEQATALEQINKALAEIDEVAQQNSALVEQNATTAETLGHQAVAMNERLSFFCVSEAVPSRARAA
jgi:methyl-accepting chemotaxis protein